VVRAEGPADEDKAAVIYRAAARIFAEKGFHATSIHEIAEAVHLTKAGLYYYIRGKQDLLYRIMSFAMDTLDEKVVAVARKEQNLARRLEAVVACHARLIIGGGNALTILVNELEGLTTDQRAEIVSRQRSYIHFIRDILDGLREEGKLHAIDSTTGAFGIVGMILWLQRWFRPTGPLSEQQVIEQISRIALYGVLQPDPTD
jgi:AcrR family transcriptional regulator